MKAVDDPRLARHLAYYGLADCTCHYRWGSLGRLHGGPMGESWIRVDTDGECRQHGERWKVRTDA